MEDTPKYIKAGVSAEDMQFAVFLQSQMQIGENSFSEEDLQRWLAVMDKLHAYSPMSASTVGVMERIRKLLAAH